MHPPPLFDTEHMDPLPNAGLRIGTYSQFVETVGKQGHWQRDRSQRLVMEIREAARVDNRVTGNARDD